MAGESTPVQSPLKAPEHRHALRPHTPETIAARINRILPLQEGEGNTDTVDAFPTLMRMTTSERADRFFSLVMAHNRWQNDTPQITQEDGSTAPAKEFNQSLMRRMTALWKDDDTKKLFIEQYGQASVDYVQFRESTFGKKVEKMEKTLQNDEAKYEELTKALFLGSDVEPDDVLAMKMDLEDLVYQLSEHRNLQNNYLHLVDPKDPNLIATKENADDLAYVSYERFRGSPKTINPRKDFFGLTRKRTCGRKHWCR